MSEMIERIARQFAAKEGFNWESLHEDEDTAYGWGRNHIRSRVRDIIAAMREPTDAMIAKERRQYERLRDKFTFR